MWLIYLVCLVICCVKQYIFCLYHTLHYGKIISNKILLKSREIDIAASRLGPVVADQ